jgi:hypothetical protein
MRNRRPTDADWLARSLPSFPREQGANEMGEKIDDGELMKIAAFKLRESANRMLTLAQKAESPLIRGKLVAVSEQLLRQERKLFGNGRTD